MQIGRIRVPFCISKTMSDNDKKIIAIDAMGGDRGPAAVLGGINQFLYQQPLLTKLL